MLIKGSRASVEAYQGRFWPAAVARDRFSMEAAIRRTAILSVTRFAHDERRHGRVRAVIRNDVDDAQARSAMRAIGKCVAVASRGWVNDLLPTCQADRSVWRYFRVCRPAGALCDTKLIREYIEKAARLNLVNACERRRLELDPPD